MLRNLLAAITLTVLAPAVQAATVVTDPITYFLTPFEITVTGASVPFASLNGDYSVTGEITTDGTIGTLGTGNVISASATASSPSNPDLTVTFDSSDADAVLSFSGVTVTATKTALDIEWTGGSGGLIEYGDGVFSAGFKQGSVIGFFNPGGLTDPIETTLASGDSFTAASVPATVPLPGGLPILGGAVALLALLRRRTAA